MPISRLPNFLRTGSLLDWNAGETENISFLVT
jgi:hypothetical protein